MGEFCIVAGIGHSATKWLCNVLHCTPQGVAFFHEPALHYVKKGWWTKHAWTERQKWAWEHEFNEKAFQPYLDFLDSNLRNHRIVGDAISWSPILWPFLDKHIHIDRVIYLVRNGVQQLHAVAYYSEWFKENDKQIRWGLDTFMREYWKVMGEPHKPWDQWSWWERMCLWWQTNAVFPEWLQEQMPDAKHELYKMDNLVDSSEQLRTFLSSFGIEMSDKQITEWQRTDINRRVQGKRAVLELWKKWTPKQREDFKRICGPGMRKLGYRMP